MVYGLDIGGQAFDLRWIKLGLKLGYRLKITFELKVYLIDWGY